MEHKRISINTIKELESLVDGNFFSNSSETSSTENLQINDRVFLSLENLTNRQKQHKKQMMFSLSDLKLCKANNSPVFSFDKQNIVTYDQGNIGSCTANAFCTTLAIMTKDKYEVPFYGSRLFFYYQERKIENNVEQDVGAYITDGLDFVLNYGICTEHIWKYNIKKYACEPTENCYTEASFHKIKSFEVLKLDSVIVENIRHNLLTLKRPVMIACLIYSNINELKSDYVLNVPNKSTDIVIGGHEMCIIGYNDYLSAFHVQNSWGNKWADNGSFYISYDYIRDNSLCFEFTVINI